MGHATALQFALCGYEVHLLGRTQALGLDIGVKALTHDLETFEANSMLREPKEDIIARITPSRDNLTVFQGVDFVLESTTEDLAARRAIFAEVEESVGDGVAIATNTSADAARRTHCKRRSGRLGYSLTPYLSTSTKIWPTRPKRTCPRKESQCQPAWLGDRVRLLMTGKGDEGKSIVAYQGHELFEWLRKPLEPSGAAGIAQGIEPRIR
ncbi:hypothetical protein J4859_08760 [Atopobium sp. oral taxon 416]|nr:hypothetical protein J4859_08760 [Atopobium sp. oral taxon 416]